MFRLPRSVSAAALCMFVCASLASPATSWAGFELEIDKSSFKLNTATSLYEANVLFRTNANGPTPDDIKVITFALSFSPVISGAQFVGITNTATNRLFPATAETIPAAPASEFWFSAIRHDTPVTLPTNSGSTFVAFTLQMSYDASVDSTTDIIFATSSYISTNDAFGTFTGTGGAMGVGFIAAVPEPGLGALSLLAVASVTLRRRLRRRRG